MPNDPLKKHTKQQGSDIFTRKKALYLHFWTEDEHSHSKVCCPCVQQCPAPQEHPVSLQTSLLTDSMSPNIANFLLFKPKNSYPEIRTKPVKVLPSPGVCPKTGSPAEGEEESQNDTRSKRVLFAGSFSGDEV